MNGINPVEKGIQWMARFSLHRTPSLLFIAGILFAGNPSCVKTPEKLNTARIEELAGHRGTLNPDGTFKISVPRTDLSVRAAGVRITPAMGLTSWAAFSPGRMTIVMGDLVLLEDQVNPVMSVALESGLDVTALHNHFFWETPRVFFMHIHGMNNAETLARAVGAVFKKISETAGGKGEVLQADLDPANTSLEPSQIESILGKKGELKDGVFKITFGREITMHGQTMGNSMGVNTWAAFVGANDRAVVDGDFAMLESELQDVLKTLRASDIQIVAIHHHMTDENPRIIFLHYWGIGRTVDLANGLRRALDKTSTGL